MCTQRSRFCRLRDYILLQALTGPATFCLVTFLPACMCVTFPLADSSSTVQVTCKATAVSGCAHTTTAFSRWHHGICKPRHRLLCHNPAWQPICSCVTFPLPDSSSILSMRRSMSGRGWWIVMITVTPAEASADRMSTTLEALLLSSPASTMILLT